MKGAKSGRGTGQHSASGSGTLRQGGKRRSAAGLISYEGDWINGFNSEAPTCVPTAIANSLMAVTGQRVTDDDVMLLFMQAGGNRLGVSVAECLAALATHGIGGHKPSGACCPAIGTLDTGDLVGLAYTHAACLTADGLVTWGDVLALDLAAEFDGEAWRIDWFGQHAPSQQRTV